MGWILEEAPPCCHAVRQTLCTSHAVGKQSRSHVVGIAFARARSYLPMLHTGNSNRDQGGQRVGWSVQLRVVGWSVQLRVRRMPEVRP